MNHQASTPVWKDRWATALAMKWDGGGTGSNRPRDTADLPVIWPFFAAWLVACCLFPPSHLHFALDPPQAVFPFHRRQAQLSSMGASQGVTQRCPVAQVDIRKAEPRPCPDNAVEEA